MELPVSLQAMQFLLAGGLGILLGLFYDFLRAVRRQYPRLTRLMDALFCILLLLSLLLFTLLRRRSKIFRGGRST